MKFELAPYNRDLADEEILDDLRTVAAQLGKDYVTKEEYDRIGRLSPSTLQKRFGSWCIAHERAGLRKIRNYKATADDCVQGLRVVAEKLGRQTITSKDYEVHGRFSLPLIARRCGSFRAALERAGLTKSAKSHETLSDEQLFENLEHLWEALGRQPTTNDYFKPLSRYSYAPYIRRFGSYRRALESFVASFESEPSVSASARSEAVAPVEVPASGVLRHKTSRGVSWRLRFLVMRRDAFKCRLCGVSPAYAPGTVLVVDHIVPWESGGETELSNLQTLCEPCNGGKSNLALNAG